MGFCRRCGEIVPLQAVRCKCGGSAVAPAVQWNKAFQKGAGNPDRWADTYTKAEKQRMVTPTRKVLESSSEKAEQWVDTHHSPMKPARRFPRPLSTACPNVPIPDTRLSHHITSITAQRTPSPTKRNPFLSLRDSPGSAPPDVFTSPDNTTLAKAYGSVLQPPETLPIHTCVSCSQVFPPDATIYPDPRTPSGTPPSFLCRSCFAMHGGSKGDCGGCGREVLTIRREGGFVENAGKVWHKHCFRCEGCHQDIGHAPMVDLFGRPSCAKCFDNCLDRRGSPGSKKQLETANNIGGLRGRSRESSPALEELSERLGIRRQPSLKTNLGLARESSASPSPMRTPTRPVDASLDNLHHSVSGQLHLRDGTPPRDEDKLGPHSKLPASLRPMTIAPVATLEPTTINLSSASSDSRSSLHPFTPSNSPQQSLTPNSRDSITPKAKKTLTRLSIVADGESKCSRCSLPLFTTSSGGQIATVPAESVMGVPTSYHASCFRCFVCDDAFDGKAQGHAMFVKAPGGMCHPECASAEKHISKPRSTGQLAPSLPIVTSNSPTERPPKNAPPLSKTFPRFGGSECCPGCRGPVSLMQYGVVSGPQSSRWHVNCLVCGGKGAKPPRPGCGKKLDSAAKTDREGGVWCRECMLLLPIGTCPSLQGSPTRGLTPTYTGTGFDRFPRVEAGRLFGQVTGNTLDLTSEKLAKQVTGGDFGLMRRGSVSPTRQMTRSVSPTKGLMPVTRHPRPVGRNKSVDERRGMFLVKQMTGNGQL